VLSGPQGGAQSEPQDRTSIAVDAGDLGGGLFSEINITPLTDVVFVLLIIFMVSSTAMMEQERAASRTGRVDLTLPESGTEHQDAAPNDVTVALLADGSMTVQGEVSNDVHLSDRVKAAMTKDPSTSVRVEADEKLEYRRVMEIVDQLEQLGVRNLSLGTRARVGP